MIFPTELPELWRLWPAGYAVSHTAQVAYNFAQEAQKAFIKHRNLWPKVIAWSGQEYVAIPTTEIQRVAESYENWQAVRAHFTGLNDKQILEQIGVQTKNQKNPR